MCGLYKTTIPHSRNSPPLHFLSISGVVTLHRVIEGFDLTYIFMDCAPNHDLFTQILHNQRYVGDNALIKYIFMQLLDVVEYSSGYTYPQDLKPETVLCFEVGLRFVVMDFVPCDN